MVPQVPSVARRWIFEYGNMIRHLIDIAELLKVFQSTQERIVRERERERVRGRGYILHAHAHCT